jgi:hypothetical protein
MGGACSAHWGIRMRTQFWMESLSGGHYSEDLSVGRWMILKWILGK